MITTCTKVFLRERPDWAGFHPPVDRHATARTPPPTPSRLRRRSVTNSFGRATRETHHAACPIAARRTVETGHEPTSARLLDHFVGAREQHRRNVEIERACRLQIATKRAGSPCGSPESS